MADRAISQRSVGDAVFSLSIDDAGASNLAGSAHLITPFSGYVKQVFATSENGSAATLTLSVDGTNITQTFDTTAIASGYDSAHQVFSMMDSTNYFDKNSYIRFQSDGVGAAGKMNLVVILGRLGSLTDADGMEPQRRFYLNYEGEQDDAASPTISAMFPFDAEIKAIKTYTNAVHSGSAPVLTVTSGSGTAHGGAVTAGLNLVTTSYAITTSRVPANDDITIGILGIANATTNRNMVQVELEVTR